MVEPFGNPGFVSRIQQEDPEALRAVVTEYLPQIVRAARGAGLSPAEADDVAQSTFLTFIEKAASFEGRSHVRTWLFGILYNKISGARREASRAGKMDDIDEVFESRFDARGHWSRPPRFADTDLLAEEGQEQIRECLDSAPARQRMAFVMREVEELSTDEICKIMDVSSTNLGVILHRARNRIRECLESRGVWGSSR